MSIIQEEVMHQTAKNYVNAVYETVIQRNPNESDFTKQLKRFWIL